MRTVHRIVSILACLAMLYVGVTGSAMQVIDLLAIARGLPESDPTIRSMDEGKFGNADFEVVTPADASARSLPPRLDFPAAFARTLEGARRQTHDGAQPTFVEVRMKGATPVGQAAFGDEVRAVDILTGAPAGPVDITPAFPPPSLRQSLKQWHRMWSSPRTGRWGVYLELLTAMALWVLIVTGFVTYYRVLRQRVRMRRRQLFWMTGGKLRGWHRSVSMTSAVILVWIAASGAWMAFEMTWHSFFARHPPTPAATLSDAQVAATLQATLASLPRDAPDVPVRVLRVREYGGMRQGVVVTGKPRTRQLVFDAATGRQVSLTEPGYPSADLPLGNQVHQDVKRLHSGASLGVWARLLDLLAGLGLVFLSVSGALIYAEMLGKRRRAGRKALFWT